MSNTLIGILKGYVEASHNRIGHIEIKLNVVKSELVESIRTSVRIDSDKDWTNVFQYVPVPVPNELPLAVKEVHSAINEVCTELMVNSGIIKYVVEFSTGDTVALFSLRYELKRHKENRYAT